MAGANRTARENSIDAASFDFAGLSHGDFVGGVSENSEAESLTGVLYLGESLGGRWGDRQDVFSDLPQI